MNVESTGLPDGLKEKDRITRWIKRKRITWPEKIKEWNCYLTRWEDYRRII